MNITLTLEVTGDENVLDGCAHQQMLDAGEAIREALNDAGMNATITFSGDNLFESL